MSDTSYCDVSKAESTAARSPDTKRRRFLMAFGAGAAGAASATALAAAPAVVVEPPEAKPASQGYQESDHVRTYYATTRI
jgi:hypothetical protein